MRDAVWRNGIGNIYEGVCTVCLINVITPLNFECGHVIAESKGGKTIVPNLRPICNKCNRSMGVQNMNDFIRTLWDGREDELPFKKDPKKTQNTQLCKKITSISNLFILNLKCLSRATCSRFKGNLMISKICCANMGMILIMSIIF